MSNWIDRIDELGSQLARQGAERAGQDDFVADNYALLKQHRLFSAMVPAELGGGGAGYGEICDALRTLARYCPSTALAVSMHQHLIAAFRWNHRNGRPGEKPLRLVADKEAVLVSTGAGDWLASKGEAVKVDGGFRVTARKPFGSGSPAGAVLVTSAPYRDPVAGWQVLHFPVPMTAEGVTPLGDWQALGMCGTGSQTISLENVFVPEEAVVLRRPRGRYHPFWDLVLSVAMPMITSVYTGVAEAAAEIAIAQCRKLGDDGQRPAQLGQMANQLVIAQLAQASMVAAVNDFDFTPSVATANASIQRKTIAADAAIATVERAIDAVGGAAYYRKVGLEKLLRDAYAGKFHPLQAARQYDFTGRVAMGLEPASEMAWAEALPQAAE